MWLYRQEFLTVFKLLMTVRSCTSAYISRYNAIIIITSLPHPFFNLDVTGNKYYINSGLSIPVLFLSC